MKVAKTICCALLALNLLPFGNSLEPVTIAIGGIFGIGSILFSAALWEPLRCRLVPCCNKRWIIQNFTGLEQDMRLKLHGQHLANQIVIHHVKAHLLAEDPSKALVLSFHGPPGVGKTFVSNILAENIYKGGQQNIFVHLISAMRDFPHQSMKSTYQGKLQAWIQGNMTICERSMFILEEVDKLPAGFLDVLVPYVDYHTTTKNVNYSKAIFILLSNTGSSNIVQTTFDHWKTGKSRETLQHSELESSIIAAINEDKDYGLWHSQLMSKNLISAFVPFLPLEKNHVIQCIRDALSTDIKLFSSSQSQKIVDDVMKQLTFSPSDEPVFSDMGCKRVSQKIYESIG